MNFNIQIGKYPMLIFAYTLTTIICLMSGCDDHGVDPPPTKEEKKWEAVPEFINLDIRYMIHFKNELYAAVVNYQSDTLYKGAILKTSDGNTWSLVKTFHEGIGPMTVEGDSLYVNSDHFIHKMDASGNWVIKFGVPWEISESQDNGDMTFFNGNLYVTQSLFTGYMFEVNPDSAWRKINPFPGLENGASGAKFIKRKKNNITTLYLRSSPEGLIYVFDGEVVTPVEDGLSHPYHGVNSIFIYNDMLLAGFNRISNSTSGTIMFLDSKNTWKIYVDSLPNSKSAFNYTPPLTTLPTNILYVNEQMFVSTDVYGVLEWNAVSGWKRISNGLMLHQNTTDDDELYNTISFLEYFRGNLFVGYGNPAYMWGTWLAGPRKGLLKYKLE